MERRHGHDHGTTNPIFSATNEELARAYWYLVAGAVVLLAIIRGINSLQNAIRLRRTQVVSVHYPTKPSNRFMQTWATLTAVGREMSYPQLYVPVRYLSWMTPPPLGRVLVLLVYWAVVIYMMASGAIIKDVYFWERIGYRNAWVTITQVPLLYLLASKTNMIGLIIGTSHERLNWLHRWVARTMFVTATVHGFYFWAEWVKYDIVEDELATLSTIVPYGLGAWGILLWMTITSFKPFRSMAYELFVIQHIFAAVAFLYVVYVHVPVAARYNVWFAIAAISFDRVCRLLSLVWQNVKFQPKKTCCKGAGRRFGHQTQLTAVGNSMTVLTITGAHFEWSAGQHLYLWMPRIGLFETHPYTIATSHPLPGTCICNSIQLVVRSHNGFSKRLNQYARKAEAAGKNATLRAFVIGPYGRPPRWDIFETLILISASTGASFTLPILESLLESKATKCTKRVDFILAAKQGEEVGFYHERLHEAIDKAESVGIELTVHIAVTGNGQLETLASVPTASDTETEKKTSARERDTATRKRLSQSSMDSHIFHAATRPDVAGFIGEAVEATGGETGVVLSAQLEKLGPLDKYPNCYPDVNPQDIYRAHIASILHDITGVDNTIVYNALQWTQSLDKGDLVLAIPALRVKGKPDELGRKWLEQWPGSPLVETPVLNAPFIPFFFKPAPLTHALISTARKLGRDYGANKANGLKDPKDPSKGQKRILVEFSSPNIAKPFHAGHLRSTIIGGFLSNLYTATGWDVVRINYLGDWGKQYGILAVGYERYGDEQALAQDPINHLFEIYVKVNKEIAEEKEEAERLQKDGKAAEAQNILENGTDEQARRYFKLMVDGDEKALALWKRFRDLSIDRYKETYNRLNIRFDEYSGESQVSEEAMNKAAKAMLDAGIAEESEGALIVDFTKHVQGKAGKSLEKPIIRRKDGTALYLTRDISELLNRNEKYNFDHMIYVIASQQDLHVKQFFKIVELMGYKEIAAKVQHISFGLVLGMSTRKGTVKFLNDILRDVGDYMHEVMKKNQDKYQQVENPDAVADILGISAVMCQDMAGKRINNYQFDMAVMTSFEGDTGPYLQYAHARLCSITRKANLSEEDIASADLSVLTETHAVNLVRVLSQWPDVVQNTLRTLEPTTILTYLFKMTHVLSSSYDHLRIVGSEPELMKARMALYDTARIVLSNGMRLLGLTPVER
ncbi:arginyl-tRNA synthetase [Xylaria palmicola]|nr:arginyl-tRNA synthetase [Xylaria palmicola]